MASELVKVMGLSEGWKDPMKLVARLGEYCISQNFHKRHCLTDEEIATINLSCRDAGAPRIVGGHMSLDSDDSGFIRLLDANRIEPKFIFYTENGKMMVDFG